MQELLKQARRERARRERRPSVYKMTGWRSVLYYLYFRNRYFFLREMGMWLFNLLEIMLAAWLLGGLQVRGLALAGRYVQFLLMMWGGATIAERILVGRYQATRQPERIARVVATFIQLGAGVGLLLAVLINALAPVLAAPAVGDDGWMLILFRHRAILLVPELISSSLFAGAYTLARMYRPLSITFLVRLVGVGSNIFLFPIWGAPVLVVNLYLPRLVDLAVTAWVSRKWAFNPHRVPALPLLCIPALNIGRVREMAPFVVGRGMGILFRDGYGLILLQAISWILPREMVFYVLFLHVLSLLYLIPRRLARTMYFDITQLLIGNRLGVLKAHVRKMDRVALAAGLATAGLCVATGAGIGHVAWKVSPEHVALLRPLIYAMTLFLLFHPQNEMWQSIREAAGELRFNNLLWFVTHYGIALPINLWLLHRTQGHLELAQSHGLEFVVVSHSLLFVRVLLVDGAMEGFRACLSRIHGLRFRWALDSPMRTARSLMDSEQEYVHRHALSLGFSQDMADLWATRFLGVGVTGLASFPYWGNRVKRFLENVALRERGLGLIRLVADRRSRAIWVAGGPGISALLSLLRSVDSVCRVAPTRLVVSLPGLTQDELRGRACAISSAVGIHLTDMAFIHSAVDGVSSIESVENWVLAPERKTKKFRGKKVEITSNADPAWCAASEWFSLRRGDSPFHRQLLDRFCASWKRAEERKKLVEEWASMEGMTILRDFLGTQVQWLRPDLEGAYDLEMSDDFRFLRRVAQTMDLYRIPDFHRFLKAETRHLLPIFFRTHLVGAFAYPSLEPMPQMDLVRVAAAFYLRATWISIGAFRWEDAEGFVIAPVFQSELEVAKQMQHEIGVPYALLSFYAPSFSGRFTSAMAAVKKAFGPDVLIGRQRRRIEILLPGMVQSFAEEKLRSIITSWSRK